MSFNAPELPTGHYVSLGLAADAVIETGEQVAINAVGNAVLADDATAIRVVGRAEADADNTGGAAGAVEVTVKRGCFKYANSSTGTLTAAHIDQPCFVEDETTVSSSPGTFGVVAGIVRRVDSDGIFVDTTANILPFRFGAHDADGATLTAADTGKVFSNLGASGAVTFVLPPATPGLEFYFAVKVAQQLRVDPNGTQTIELPSTAAQQAAGKYIVADAIAEFLHIRCLVAGAWSVVSSGGTWTVEP